MAPMRFFLPLLMILAAACSGEQIAGQMDPNQSEQSSALVNAAIPLGGRVTDAANILSSEQEAVLTDRLALLEKSTKHQVVVVTANSLGGRDVADFTRDLANAWGIGRKDHDDGVVILVAPNERKVRIAVGHGLERTLPDPLCKAIIEQNMLPRFRDGNFYGGIEAGIGALIEGLKRTV